MSLFELAPLHRPAAGEMAGLRIGRSRRRGRGEMTFGQPQELVLVHGAGGADHQAIGGVEAGAPGFQAGRGRLGDGGRGAKDRPAERLAGEGGGLGQFEHLVIRRVGGLGDLLQHHVLFPGEVVGVERRALDEIGGDGHGQRQASGQGADLEAGALMAGGGVDLAAFGLNRLDDIARLGARRRP